MIRPTLLLVFTLLFPTTLWAEAADVAPTTRITQVQPTHAPTDSATVVTVFGEGLVALDTTVTIGTVPATVIDGDYNFVRVTLPTGLAEGHQSVELTSPWGSDTLVDGITLTAPGTLPGPVLERVNVTGVPAEPGSEMCVEGRNFVEGAHITFEGEPVTEVTFISAEQLCTTVPEYIAGGSVEVRVVNPDGLEAYQYLYTGPEALQEGDCACTTVTRSPGLPAMPSLMLFGLGLGLAFWRRSPSKR